MRSPNKPAKGAITNSYQVSIPQYGAQFYPKYEMAEFSATNPYANGNYVNGSASNGRVNPQQQNGYDKRTVIEDEEEEYDRGHWGSKAEFILSCVGFSVRDHILRFENSQILKQKDQVLAKVEVA